MTAGEAILSTDADGGDNGSILDSGNSSTMTVPLMGPSRHALGFCFWKQPIAIGVSRAPIWRCCGAWAR